MAKGPSMRTKRESLDGSFDKQHHRVKVASIVGVSLGEIRELEESKFAVRRVG
jgi:hypothetical protein